MGCYDTIIVNCPHCGEKYCAQSKSGECNLEVYPIAKAPKDVMADANRHAPFVCPACHKVFKIDIKKRKTVKLGMTEKDVSKDFEQRMNSGNPALGRTEVEKVMIKLNAQRK